MAGSASISFNTIKLIKEADGGVSKDSSVVTCRYCFEEEALDSGNIVHVCKSHNHYLCLTCLKTMFKLAADFTGCDEEESTSPMPPMCCGEVIPIHAVVKGLGNEVKRQYRAKLAQFMRFGQHCPNPNCLKWIPEQLNPGRPSPTQLPTTFDVLSEILDEVYEEVHTNDPPLSQEIMDYLLKVLNCIHRLDRVVYGSIDHLTLAIEKAVQRTYRTYSSDALEVKAVDNMLHAYHEKVRSVTGMPSLRMELLYGRNYQPTLTIFLCSSCQFRICCKCQKAAHGSTLCDTTAEDAEARKLEALGMKRCPLCKVHIEKRDGCHHMVCRCGADFCWNCGQSRWVCKGHCEGLTDPTAFVPANATLNADGEPEMVEYLVMIDGNNALVFSERPSPAVVRAMRGQPEGSANTDADNTAPYEAVEAADEMEDVQYEGAQHVNQEAQLVEQRQHNDNHHQNNELNEEGELRHDPDEAYEETAYDEAGNPHELVSVGSTNWGLYRSQHDNMDDDESEDAHEEDDVDSDGNVTRTVHLEGPSVYDRWRAPREQVQNHVQNQVQHAAEEYVTEAHVAAEHVTAEHTAEEHTAEEHTAGEHAAEEHTAEEHTAEEHTAEEHTAEEHTAEEHAAEEHAAEEHAPAEHDPNEHAIGEHDADEDGAETEEDEEEEDPVDFLPENLRRQIWACRHLFGLYLFPAPGYNVYQGELSRMECNRCYNHVEPYFKSNRIALQCRHCQMIVCHSCADKFEEAGKGSRVLVSFVHS